MTIGDFFETQSQEVEPFFDEVALMKQLIEERTHPLALLRVLISNAGAREVGASKIHITYYVHPRYGHAFEVEDDGCGMNFTNEPRLPGRLDRFLGLGLSAIAGYEADEFSWKGLGSKLAYQSRRVEIETCNGKRAYSVIVNEPWQTIEDGKKPRPQVSKMPVESHHATGTTVRVFGHPPHRQEDPFTFEEIKDYLTHRTFVGFTGDRQSPPRITLTAQSRTEEIPFGFPEFGDLPAEAPEGTVIVAPPVVVTRNLAGTNRNVHVLLKGFYTWDERDYGLADVHLNTGLILSVKGIPYFTLNMRELGSGQLAVANPGPGKCCLVIECDSIQTEMNISRSALVDSALTQHFRGLVAEAIREIEDTPRHRAFRQVTKRRKEKKSAIELRKRKETLESLDQPWVFWQPGEASKPIRLLREPANETDALAVLWKLEALDALPFAAFETLAYSGKGADLIVHFQEDATSSAERYTTMEAEHRFYNFKAHKHLIPQFPTVICWDINPRPRLSVKKTPKPYKFVVQLEETTLRIYALSQMPGVFVATEEEMKRRRASEAWSTNL
jgi:hypothetical protein